MTATLPARRRIFVTAGLLVAAFLCYGIGYTPGFGGFFLAGALFETVFWVRLFNRRPSRRQRLKALHDPQS